MNKNNYLLPVLLLLGTGPLLQARHHNEGVHLAAEIIGLVRTAIAPARKPVVVVKPPPPPAPAPVVVHAPPAPAPVVVHAPPAPAPVVVHTPPPRPVVVIPEYGYGWWQGVWVPCYNNWYWYHGTWVWGGRGPRPVPPRWAPDFRRRPMPPPPRHHARPAPPPRYHRAPPPRHHHRPAPPRHPGYYR